MKRRRSGCCSNDCAARTKEMNCRFLTFVLIIAASHLNGATKRFPEHNFSIEIPSNWTDIVPQPSGALIASQSPDHQRRFLVFAHKFSSKERNTSAADVRAGMKESMSKLGGRIEPEVEGTIGGQPSIVFKCHV